MIKDVGMAGVLHENVSAFNVLHCTSDSLRRCEHHRKRHRWRLVDFDRSCAFDVTVPNRELDDERRWEGEDIGGKYNSMFWETFER